MEVQSPTSPYVIQLNTKTGPFTDPKAREAIYRATDFDAINEGIFGGQYEVGQGFTAPGGLFYQQKVDGYPEFDLDEAKKLVEELGGLTVKLGTISNYVATQINTALQTQWEKAGIEVEIEDYQLSTLIQQFTGGQWQAMLQTAGAWDPAAGVGVGFRFGTHLALQRRQRPRSGRAARRSRVDDRRGERGDLYQQAAELIAKNFYAPFGLAFAPGQHLGDGRPRTRPDHEDPGGPGELPGRLGRGLDGAVTAATLPRVPGNRDPRVSRGRRLTGSPVLRLIGKRAASRDPDHHRRHDPGVLHPEPGPRQRGPATAGARGHSRGHRAARGAAGAQRVRGLPLSRTGWAER